MIPLDDAIAIAIAKEGGDLVVDPHHILEKPYGWVIFPNTKEFIETGDIGSQMIGSGGVLVLKDNGKAIQFGSAFSVEENLEIYESGYLDHDNWDIVVTRVVDERNAVSQILALDVTYVIPEEDSGTVWRVRTAYSRKRIADLIRESPTRFNIGPIYFNYDVVRQLKQQRYFDYRFEPNRGYENVL